MCAGHLKMKGKIDVQLKRITASCRIKDKGVQNRYIEMSIHDVRRESVRHSVKSGSEGRRAVYLKSDAHFLESELLSPWRRDPRDGTQASFGKEVGLVLRQIEQGVKDFWIELQQVERLRNSCSGHAKVFGQVCLSGESPLIEEVFENERLFHRIDDRALRLDRWRTRPRARGFEGRYETLALVQSRKVNPESQIEEVRKSFGPGEPLEFTA